MSLVRLSLVATAVVVLLACGASPPRPAGPGPEYEDPPALGAAAGDAGLVDAASR